MNNDHPVFRDRIVFESFELADESRREAVFAQGNGVLSVRGAAPDARNGERRYAGTYRAGLYNRLDSNIEGQTVTNESLVRLPD